MCRWCMYCPAPPMLSVLGTPTVQRESGWCNVIFKQIDYLIQGKWWDLYEPCWQHCLRSAASVAFWSWGGRWIAGGWAASSLSPAVSTVCLSWVHSRMMVCWQQKHRIIKHKLIFKSVENITNLFIIIYNDVYYVYCSTLWTKLCNVIYWPSLTLNIRNILQQILIYYCLF